MLDTPIRTWYDAAHKEGTTVIEWTQENRDKLRALYGTMPMQQLAEMFGATTSSIKHVASRYGFSNPVHYSLNQDFFAQTDTPEKAYWLGFLFADGALWRRRNKISNVSVEVIASDASHVELLRQAVGSNAPLKYRRNAVRLHLCGEKFATPLYILRPKETAEPWKGLSATLVRHFARGVFDGDGSIYKANKWNVYRVTVVGSFSLCLLFKKLFGAGTVSPILHTKGPIYRFDCAGKNNIASAFTVMYGDGGPRLERKYQRFVEYGIIT